MPDFSTVKQVSELLNIREHGILSLIKSGDLVAIDVSLTAGGRPRWRIMADDLDSFIARRTHQPRPTRRRRKKQRKNVREFF